MLTLSETRLRDNPALLDFMSVPGYITVLRNRESIKGGGVGSYIRNDINFKHRKDIENLQLDLEYLWVEIPGSNKHSKALVEVMYRSTHILRNSDWLERLGSLLGHLTATWDGLLLAGASARAKRAQRSPRPISRFQFGCSPNFPIFAHSDNCSTKPEKNIDGTVTCT